MSLEYIGLARSNGSEVGNAFVANFEAACIKSHEDEQRWIADLRASGVKAAHPDDGWVNREKNSVAFTYPQFDDGPVVGDVIALGRHCGPCRLVEVTGVSVSKWNAHWKSFSFKQVSKVTP